MMEKLGVTKEPLYQLTDEKTKYVIKRDLTFDEAVKEIGDKNYVKLTVQKE